jgi:hypothetical protein
VVDSHTLAPDTEYDIVATVWNSSTLAPVAGLPVEFSYLSFGIGGSAHLIGVTAADLGVKGSPNCPAYARHRWKTPDVPGHYCVQVQLHWFDDANPANNLGQHNTDVKTLNSPHVSFQVPVVNTEPEGHTVQLRADGYVLPALPDCGQGPRLGESLAQRFMSLAATHGLERQQPPSGWTVHIDPSSVDLPANSQELVTVDVVAPDGFTGRQAINLNGFVSGVLVGGVTVYATSDNHS